MGRKRLKEREKTDPAKAEKVNFTHFRRHQMNTLTIIKKQINKASALHDAQISHTAYRGVEYNVNCAEQKDAHGTYCYRGRTYTK